MLIVRVTREGDGPELDELAAAVSVDGAGSGRCDWCAGRLEFSWRVTYSDGSRRVACSLHVPAVPPRDELARCAR